jgi:hypothetical protein
MGVETLRFFAKLLFFFAEKALCSYLGYAYRTLYLRTEVFTEEGGLNGKKNGSVSGYFPPGISWMENL